MEIFNIHIFEFLLIAGLALVVFGPERLPEVGRFLGKQVARFLAWQQQSPELKMINDVRGEFEKEIASLRDELVRTRKQLDVQQDLSGVKDQLRSALDLRGDIKGVAANAANAATAANAAEPSIAPPRPAGPAEAAAEAGAQAAETAIEAAEVAIEAAETAAHAAEAAETAAHAAQPAAAPAAPAQTVPAAVRPNKLAASQPTSVLGPPPPPAEPPTPPHRRNLHDSAHLDDPPPAPPPAPAPAPEAPADERDRLAQRLEGMLADMQALVAELQGRGLLGPDWQPPSQARDQETVTR